MTCSTCLETFACETITNEGFLVFVLWIERVNRTRY